MKWCTLPALVASALALGSCSILDPAAPDPDPGRAWIATYFLDNGQAGVYLAASADARLFEPLLSPNIPIMAPKIGSERLVRDACLFRGPGGMWHMTWTTGWGEIGFGVANSTNLVEWSGQKFVKVMDDEPGAVNCWAPEVTFDPARSEYLFIWSTTVRGKFTDTESAGDPGADGVKYNHRFYCTTTRDFETYTPSRLWYDPGFNCIDATLLAPESPGDAWHLFFKDETRSPPKKNIRHLRVDDPQHPHGDPSPPITGCYWSEGPTAIRVDGKVRVFFDRYLDNRFGAVESEDLERWTDLRTRVSFSPGARHGTIVEVDREFVEDLKQRLAARARAPASGALAQANSISSTVPASTITSAPN